LTKDDNVRLRPGDVIRQETPGGGGYGNPLERDMERVLHDVRQAYISRETARDVYGVVLQDGSFEIDRDATEALRRRRLSSGSPAGKNI
jgi:N-methylhydantoinase B